MSFDIDSTLRWLKPHRLPRVLTGRDDAALPWAYDAPVVGEPLLVDTTVYFDVLQDRLPATVDAILTSRVSHHSAICVAELAHAFGRLDPTDARTPSVLSELRETIHDIPEHRLSAPDTDTWGGAGILAGALFRLGGFAPGSERKCLNDALLYLQARKLGAAVLTRNVKDFDLLNQLVPDGKILLYRC